ncbi:hypothetical protein NL676_025839 [Syzygium grande]|nr:hypothetical protein NL676_025839 [Syzygium grande]
MGFFPPVGPGYCSVYGEKIPFEASWTSVFEDYVLESYAAEEADLYHDWSPPSISDVGLVFFPEGKGAVGRGMALEEPTLSFEAFRDDPLTSLSFLTCLAWFTATGTFDTGSVGQALSISAMAINPTQPLQVLSHNSQTIK